MVKKESAKRRYMTKEEVRIRLKKIPKPSRIEYLNRILTKDSLLNNGTFETVLDTLDNLLGREIIKYRLASASSFFQSSEEKAKTKFELAELLKNRAEMHLLRAYEIRHSRSYGPHRSHNVYDSNRFQRLAKREFIESQKISEKAHSIDKRIQPLDNIYQIQTLKDFEDPSINESYDKYTASLRQAYKFLRGDLPIEKKDKINGRMNSRTEFFGRLKERGWTLKQIEGLHDLFMKAANQRDRQNYVSDEEFLQVNYSLSVHCPSSAQNPGVSLSKKNLPGFYFLPEKVREMSAGASHSYNAKKDTKIYIKVADIEKLGLKPEEVLKDINTSSFPLSSLEPARYRILDTASGPMIGDQTVPGLCCDRAHAYFGIEALGTAFFKKKS